MESASSQDDGSRSRRTLTPAACSECVRRKTKVSIVSLPSALRLAVPTTNTVDAPDFKTAMHIILCKLKGRR